MTIISQDVVHCAQWGKVWSLSQSGNYCTYVKQWEHLTGYAQVSGNHTRNAHPSEGWDQFDGVYAGFLPSYQSWRRTSLPAICYHVNWLIYLARTRKLHNKDRHKHHCQDPYLKSNFHVRLPPQQLHVQVLSKVLQIFLAYRCLVLDAESP
jgi:hypothetical protein